MEPPATAPINLGAALEALRLAERAVDLALVKLFPLDSVITVTVPRLPKKMSAIVTGYVGGRNGTIQVTLLGARGFTKQTTREIPARDIIMEEQ